MKQSHGHYSTKGWSKHTVKSMEQRHGTKAWNRGMEQRHETKAWNKGMEQRHDHHHGGHHDGHHDGHITITLLERYIIGVALVTLV